MEIKSISEAKTMLMAIIDKENFCEEDYQGLKDVLNSLLKIETSSKEINVISKFNLLKVERKD